jgi:hypothetical protein
LVSLAGCSSGPPAGDQPTAAGPDDPYGDIFEREIGLTTSDFQKRILEDHEVTEAEYNEAEAAFVDCLSDIGVEVVIVKNDNGSSQLSYTGGDSQNPGVQECSDKWYGAVDSLYQSVLTNPNNVQWMDAMAACFVRLGLVPEGFSASDLKPLMDPISNEYSLDADGEATVLKEADPNATPTLPGGIALDSEQTAPCYQDPFQAVR